MFVTGFCNYLPNEKYLKVLINSESGHPRFQTATIYCTNVVKNKRQNKAIFSSNVLTISLNLSSSVQNERGGKESYYSVSH